MPASFTEIDLGHLELEWLQQPKLYGRYAKRLADAKLDLSEAKAAFSIAVAEAKRSLRKNPAKYGISGRVTDGIVKDYVVLVPKYQKAEEALNKAKHTVDVLDGVVNTLEHRKRTLEGLVTLHGQNYFSKPKLKKGMNEKFAERTEQERDRAVLTRKRKKR